MLYREPGKAEPAVSGLSKDGKSVASSKASVAAEDEEASNQGLGWFGRIAFGPQNRNFVGFYVESGLVYTGAIPTRDEDQVGVGFVYAQLTNGARRTLELEGSRGVGAEMVLEVTYQAQSHASGCISSPMRNLSSILVALRIWAMPLLSAGACRLTSRGKRLRQTRVRPSAAAPRRRSTQSLPSSTSM